MNNATAKLRCRHSRTPLAIENAEGDFTTPLRGGFFLPLKEGRTVMPHISFSPAREKETCRSPRQEPRFPRLRSEKRLREKLGEQAACIKTVIKAGYRLEG